MGTINEMNASGSEVASPSGVTKAWDWVKTIFKALAFDYAWFQGWIIGSILRAICIFFSIASIYLILDLLWKVRSIIFGG
jgi:hypothetical protein